ncbi:MAG: cytochrome c-type biogenesis protein CcmE [Myxococcota bacterium]|jgi:cytochrome c-type biogenesis protein CcmE
MSDSEKVRVGIAGPIILVVCVALVGGALWFLQSGMGGLSENLVYYMSPTQLIELGDDSAEATVRLGGQVEVGTVDFDVDENMLTFVVTDGVEEVTVTCAGAPPQMFREGIGVVVEGQLQADGVFHTDRVIVKHSNEYRAPEEGERASDVYQTLVMEES